MKNKILILINIALIAFTVLLSFAFSVQTYSSNVFTNKIVIENKVGRELNNHPVLVKINTENYINQGLMESDCSNISFKDLDGVRVDFWLESGCGSNSAHFWVNVPTLKTNSSNILMDYGINLGLGDLSEIGDVFPVLESQDLALWVAANDLAINQGQSIEFLQDRSNKNNHLSQGNTSLRPVLGFNSDNDLPSIVFDSNLKKISNSDLNNLSSLPLSLNAIVENISDGRSQVLKISNNSQFSDKIVINKINNESRKGYNHFEVGADFRALSGGFAFNDSDVYGYEGNKNVNIGYQINSQRLTSFYNDTFREYQPESSIPQNNFGSLELGGFEGSIQEFIMFSKDLNDQETKQVNQYLDIKYKTNEQSISSYIDENYLYNIPFGSISHQIQPFRSEMKTEYATDFLNGIGMGAGLNFSTSGYSSYYKLLADYGVSRIRYEIPWGAMDYNSDNLLADHENRLRETIKAAKNAGIRPLLLLNWHHGAPVSNRRLDLTLTSDVNIGDKVINVSDTSQITPDYTGFNQDTPDTRGVPMAGNMIEEKTQTSFELSFPIDQAFDQGDIIYLYKLKYRPFSVDGFESYQETIDGFYEYLDEVVRIATDELGTSQNTDKGFDLELYNELSFGYSFNNINLYYQDDIVDFTGKQSVVEYLPALLNQYRQNNSLLSGITITNGFESQRPWGGGFNQELDAMSKHYYASHYEMPQNNPSGVVVDQNGNETDFIPEYISWHPENTSGSAIRTETLMRDLVSFDNYVYGGLHGRYSKIDQNGERVELPIYHTEMGLGQFPDGSANESLIDLSSETKELEFKSKMLSRLFPFLIGKGSESVYAFKADAQNGLNPQDEPSEIFNKYLALLSRENMDYFKTTANDDYPSDASFAPKTLEVIKNMTDEMKSGLDESAFDKRDLYIRDWSSNNPVDLVPGNNQVDAVTSEDKFTFLPFQVNQNKFVVPYYVMTSNMADSFSEEIFDLDIYGLIGENSNVRVYDPYLDQDLNNFSINETSSESLSINLPTVDYTRYLIVEEDDSFDKPNEIDGFVYAQDEGLVSAIKLQVKVYLQGALIGVDGVYSDQMRNNISLYNQSVDSNYVDEVTLEVLDSNKNLLQVKDFWIDIDGNLVDKNSLSINLEIESLVDLNDYYFNIKHRNHIGVGTSSLLNIKSNQDNILDLTSSNDVIFGNQFELPNGKFALNFGDIDGNGIRNAADRNISINTDSKLFTYSNEDLNLDSVINATDRNYAINNSTIFEILN